MTHRIYAMDTHFMRVNPIPPLPEQLALVRAAGYDDYYLCANLNTPDKSLAHARATRENGLGLSGVYFTLNAAVSPTDTDIADFRNLVEALDATTRIELAFQYNTFGEKVGDPAADAGTINWLRTLLPLLEEKCIRICLYPHFGLSLERMTDALRLIRAIPHELLGLMFCGYHWYRVDRTPVRKQLDLAGDRLFGVNLSGSTFVGPANKVNGLDPLIQPLDEGDMDNRDVLRALTEHGYTGPIGVQGYGVTAPPADALRRSRAWLAECLAQIKDA